MGSCRHRECWSHRRMFLYDRRTTPLVPAPRHFRDIPSAHLHATRRRTRSHSDVAQDSATQPRRVLYRRVGGLRCSRVPDPSQPCSPGSSDRCTYEEVGRSASPSLRRNLSLPAERPRAHCKQMPAPSRLAPTPREPAQPPIRPYLGVPQFAGFAGDAWLCGQVDLEE